METITYLRTIMFSPYSYLTNKLVALNPIESGLVTPPELTTVCGKMIRVVRQRCIENKCQEACFLSFVVVVWVACHTLA